MAKLIKPWNDGGSISVTYDGSGDGEAVFSSDTNEGIDREMSISFKGGGISVERTIWQEGLREEIMTADGLIFKASDGYFGVLKEAKQLYTELDYIQSTGTQYINTGLHKVLFTRADKVFVGLTPTVISSASYFFGTMVGSRGFGVRTRNATWIQGGLWQGGGPASANVDTIYQRFDIELSVENGFVLNGVKQATSGTGNPNLTVLTEFPFYIGAYTSATGLAATEYTISATKLKCHYLQVERNGELAIDLIPVVDNDGVVCMYDKVSGEFFYNQGTGDFIAGYK